MKMLCSEKSVLTTFDAEDESPSLSCEKDEKSGLAISIDLLP
jgi:hypothetical protein